MTMTRKQRATKEAGVKAPVFTLTNVKPMTINQSRIFKEWSRGQHLLLHGFAGTGKSYVAIYLALREIEKEGSPYDRLVLIRSAVPSRKQGFLPGTEEEKAAVFEVPYKSIVDDLYKKGGAYNRLKETKVIDFETTSYLRGLTISNAIVVLDEVQNLDDGEVNTVMTRMGENTRVFLCGDTAQNDLKRSRNEVSCIGDLLDTVAQMPSFSTVELGINDIVRSGLVKEWILARS